MERKASTINMMIGLSRPTSGQIMIDGMDGIKEIKRFKALLALFRMKTIYMMRWMALIIFVLCLLYGLGRVEQEKEP